MEKEYVRYNWEQYKELLEKLEYSEEQILEVQKTRENLDYMSAEQFRFLFLSGVIKRTVKNKKPRSYYTNGEDILYLNHWSKQFEKAGYFINEEE